MRSFTLRALFWILGGVLLLSLVLSDSTGRLGFGGPCSRWEPDGKPGSLPRGTWFVVDCCGPNVAGGAAAVGC